MNLPRKGRLITVILQQPVVVVTAAEDVVEAGVVDVADVADEEASGVEGAIPIVVSVEVAEAMEEAMDHTVAVSKLPSGGMRIPAFLPACDAILYTALMLLTHPRPCHNPPVISFL